jgi:hypothetical protein
LTNVQIYIFEKVQTLSFQFKFHLNLFISASKNLKTNFLFLPSIRPSAQHSPSPFCLIFFYFSAWRRPSYGPCGPCPVDLFLFLFQPVEAAATVAVLWHAPPHPLVSNLYLHGESELPHCLSLSPSQTVTQMPSLPTSAELWRTTSRRTASHRSPTS